MTIDIRIASKGVIEARSLRNWKRGRRLNTTQDPRSVLDEKWVQYFRDGLVETTHSGRSGCSIGVERVDRSIADEFQDGP